jgi:hypothetical protein
MLINYPDFCLPHSHPQWGFRSSRQIERFPAPIVNLPIALLMAALA